MLLENTTTSLVDLNANYSETGSGVEIPIALDDNQHWYRDRHYVAINFYEGININTMV